MKQFRESQKLLSILSSVLIACAVNGQLLPEGELLTVKTCCDEPYSVSNVTWCHGIYSQSQNIDFKYGQLECPEVTNASFSIGSVWEGNNNGFYTDYFLKFDDRFYSPSDYCLRGMTDDHVDLRICKPKCNGDKLCIPKCCNLWDDVTFQNNTVYCVPSFEPSRWTPSIFHETDFSSLVDVDAAKFHFYVNNPSRNSKECTTVRLIQYQHFDFKILQTGEVAWTSSDVLDWYRVPEGRFCVDREIIDTETPDTTEGIVVLVGCLEDFIPTINDSLNLVDTINFVLTQISLGFLALTLIIYILLRRHQNIHSWTQFSYFFALWSNLFIASIIYFQTHEDPNLKVANEAAGQPRGPMCFTASILSTFFHNATLTTMLALAIDVFKMFRHLLDEGSNQEMTKSEFVRFQILSWGCAIIMSIAGISLHFGGTAMASFPPMYGYVNCKAKFWLGDEILEGICHLFTATLFLITVVRIGLVRLKGHEEVIKVNSQRHYSRALSLLFKLLIVMGMTWTSILLSFLFVKSTVHLVRWFFTLMEFTISLQGFVIFLMFAFNRKTLDSLGENYSIIRKLSNASSTSGEPKTELPNDPVHICSISDVPDSRS